MPNPVIQCSGLGKSYLIGHQGARERYSALRDVMARQVRGVWQATRRAFRGQVAVTGDEIEEFWALRDVSFEVQEGEVVGIIGRNGAGKSTLLKILSRITEPTEGRVTLRGRVASLLEVGTGFHPELSGRENIYLNGAILGMTRSEIKRKFDEIVSFAEVERFLDTPVKRFSSGMYVRLAFAVAAHLEPEILVVDEVLAVGDAEFQKKCLGKMQDVSRGGRTVLFVSHNMSTIQTLCSTALQLKDGQIVKLGDASTVVAAYLSEFSGNNRGDVFESRRISKTLSIERLVLSPNPLLSGNECSFSVQLRSTVDTQVRGLSILLYSGLGTRVAIIDLRCPEGDYRIDANSTLTLSGRIKSLPLVEGDYSVGLFTHAGEFHGDTYDISTLAVIHCAQNGRVTPYLPHYRGVLELSYELVSK